MTENEIAKIVHDKYQKVLQTLGVGLLEKAYQTVLDYELRQAGLHVEAEVELPVNYEGIVLDHAYRVDLAPIHRSQLLTYLKMSGKRLGLLINFGDTQYTDNFKRVLNCDNPSELDK